MYGRELVNVCVELRILPCFVIYDSGQVSLEHLLLSRCPSTLTRPAHVRGRMVVAIRSQITPDCWSDTASTSVEDHCARGCLRSVPPLSSELI